MTDLCTDVSLAKWQFIFSRSPDVIWWTANHLLSSAPWHKPESSTESTRSFELLLLQLECMCAVRVTRQRAALLQVTFHSERCSLVESGVIQSEAQCHSLYYSKITQSDLREWFESLKFRWKLLTSYKGGQSQLEVEGCVFISCATWIRPSTSCSWNNLCVSFPPHVWWIVTVFRIVGSSRRKKSFLGHCHVLGEML